MKRFEEELKKLKGRNHNDNEPVASSSTNPAQELPGSSNQLSENEQYAKALLIAVRKEIYEKGDKSANKLRAAPPDEDKNQWEKKEEERIYKANNEVRRIHMPLPYFSGVPSFLPMQKIISNTIEAKGHNCTDLARAGIGILDEAGIKDTHIVHMSDFNHQIILIGKIPPRGLPLAMEEWSSHLAICDPWANIACPAKAFIPACMEKMQKWDGNGKKVYDYDKNDWANPVYADLEKDLRGRRRVYPPLGGKEHKGKGGRTPLMAAIYTGQVDDIQILLKAGADIEAKDSKGLTPLLVATYQGKVEALSILLKAGANIEAKDSQGRTALMIAAESGNVELVNALLKADANIEAENEQGRTPLSYARKSGKVEVVAALLMAGASPPHRVPRRGASFCF